MRLKRRSSSRRASSSRRRGDWQRGVGGRGRGGGAGGRLTRFATRIPTLQPESLLYNHRHCFRCQNPNPENDHFATRLLRVFVRL